MSLRPAADAVVPPVGAAPTNGNRLRQVLATGATREARDTEQWMIVLSFKGVEVGHLTDEGTPKMLEISIRDNPYTAPGNTPAVELEEAVGEAIKGWMRAGFQMGDYGSFSHIGKRFSAGRRHYKVVVPRGLPTTNGFHEDVGPQLLKAIYEEFFGTFKEPHWYDWRLTNPRMKPDAGTVAPSRFDF